MDKENRKKRGRSLALARDRPVKKSKVGELAAAKCSRYCNKLSGMNWRKMLSQNFPYILCGYFGNKVFCLYQKAESGDVFIRVMRTFEGLDDVFDSLLPSMNPADVLFGIACGAALKMAVYVKRKNAKKYRQGVEYGSAR